MSEEMFFTVLAILLGSAIGRSLAYYMVYHTNYYKDKKEKES